eukprot:TRINITY_DN14541_c0_g1_i2.p2 TRINITY_DN14541_c0_g1~~TRINITY_DN14541_c0_g1_i2.p2  ORF type:complete len:101 (+),score=29.39 TRINITY_DN14541_c0_g1_i2:511-813(+)
MDAWADDQKVGRDGEETIINMLADPHRDLTRALGMEMAHPGPRFKLGDRCKRFSAYFVDGVLKVLNVAEKPDDPAGDDFPEISLAAQMIADVEALSKTEL